MASTNIRNTNMSPLSRIDNFEQPKSWTRLLEWIDQFPEEQRIEMTAAAAMAWNLAVHIQEEYGNDEVTPRA